MLILTLAHMSYGQSTAILAVTVGCHMKTLKSKSPNPTKARGAAHKDQAYASIQALNPKP